MNKTAQGLAKKGRYGDTMLVHMAPSEVSGIASLTPGGMTVNPDTGLPEMFKFKDFLRIALPIAGAVMMPAALGVTGAFATGAAAGGGSAIGTLLAGGSSQEALESGLVTGLTAGIGTKLAGAKAAAGAGGEAATTAGANTGKLSPAQLLETAPLDIQAAGTAQNVAMGVNAPPAPPTPIAPKSIGDVATNFMPNLAAR